MQSPSGIGRGPRGVQGDRGLDEERFATRHEDDVVQESARAVLAAEIAPLVPGVLEVERVRQVRERRRMRKRTTRLWATIGLAIALNSCEPAGSSGHVREAALPRGAVESPQPATVVTSELVVSGWASSPDGLEEVAIYVNGDYVDSAVLGFSRPDVLAADPANVPEGTSGFLLRVEAFRLPRGHVSLVVQVRTRAGATRDVGVVPITVTRPG